MNAGIAAYVILTQNTDVTDIVGVNIFPEVAEQETATPFIVYQLLSVAPEDTHDGPSTLDEVRFEFLCYADSYALAADLGSKVRGALDRVSGTYNGVNVESIQFNDVDIDTIDAPRRFAQVLTFTFRIKRDDVEIAQGTPVTGAKLGDLYDVDTTGVTNGQVIAYDAAAQEWQPADGTGGVTELGQLDDVDIIAPEQGDVLSYNAGVQEWMVNGGLQELLARFKASGTGAQMYDTLNDTTKGYIDILAASATMKVNHSGLTISEASPGVMSFSVAAGTSGNEVEFEAMTIEGSDAVATVADINFKQGALTYWENATGKIWLRAPNAGNITVLLPSSGGTLALTADIPNVPVDSVNGQTGVVVLDTGDIDENGNLYFTDARVAANAAVAANTAKVGITPSQAAEITANTAKVSYTDVAVDARIAAADIGDRADIPSAMGTTGQVLAVNTGATALEYVDQSGGGGISFDYARAIMGSDVLQGGASQQNFDSATAQKVKFNTSADTEGTGITIDTTNNRITVGATGYYQITSNLTFFSAIARTTPAATLKVNGTTNLLGEGYGYIRAATGQDENNNLITCIVELQANDYVEVFVGDTSTASGALYATQAFLEISSTGGAAGATGAQGPSGTTYDVVTLTGSTTLSSAHTTKYLVVNSSSSVDITVPASAAYDTHAEFVIEQRGTGGVTIVAASGVTINTSETLVAAGQYAVMGLKRTASNVYTLTGERIAS